MTPTTTGWCARRDEGGAAGSLASSRAWLQRGSASAPRAERQQASGGAAACTRRCRVSPPVRGARGPRPRPRRARPARWRAAMSASAPRLGLHPGAARRRGGPWRQTATATPTSAALTTSRPGASRCAATPSTTPASVDEAERAALPRQARALARHARAARQETASTTSATRHDHAHHGDADGEQARRRPGRQRLVEAQRALVGLPAPVAHAARGRGRAGSAAARRCSRVARESKSSSWPAARPPPISASAVRFQAR